MSAETLCEIENSYYSYQQLINLYANHKEEWFGDIDVNLYGWFSANSSSVLGAILTKFQNNLNTVRIFAEKSESILKRNGFLSHFGHSKAIDYNHTAIAYQVLSTEDDRYFNNYVFKEFISRPDLPVMTDALKRKLAESIYEIFINAKMHSQTEKIFVCGQFFPKKHKIIFTITDIGIGIKNVVNNRFGSNLSAIQAIEWAIQDKHTTKKDVSGGIGLALLHEFIKLNRGTVQIVSNEGFWELSHTGKVVRSFTNEFPGTMVNISVCTNDANQYMLSKEVTDDIF
ncbi:hypothetical protein SAMN02746065_104130 [Desulfocicer vacuolatum DSM 3385]|uniref:Histidine kinase-, DNA gyrase B-, and HSP90-like ATPase n=1 Tax=Desulfocicer vacuolatum DSM 3385 TaxID=1121400 RepID=A0A1W2A5Q3_9BACT|nr:HAMP domain-containing histidine kinase [Desulfocicer vacuolatum]SMC55802.1 hypothetical protein SAMN02746065_104130 [Desulfocicer vacuolatum DSM 3385]